MKTWQTPKFSSLSTSETEFQSDYLNICNWNEIEEYGVGNEEYTDPNNKPLKHPDWIWCQVHRRWHPKDHANGSVPGQS